jgi:hypothetical protein
VYVCPISIKQASLIISIKNNALKEVSTPKLKQTQELPQNIDPLNKGAITFQSTYSFKATVNSRTHKPQQTAPTTTNLQSNFFHQKTLFLK